jgi:N-acetylneuraminic acid mutarotase
MKKQPNFLTQAILFLLFTHVLIHAFTHVAQAQEIRPDGVYVPRMTTSQRNAIANPTNGQLIFNLDDYCFNVFQGIGWQLLCDQQAGLSDKWTPLAPVGATGRQYAVGFSVGSKGYVGFGSEGAAFKTDFFEYDPATNTWSPKASFVNAARNSAVSFSIGNKGYMGLGNNNGNRLGDMWEYDPATNQWTAKTAFAGGIRSGAVGFSIGGKGYVGLGNGGNYVTDFWEYDPVGNSGMGSWTPKTAFPGTARDLAVSFSIGNKGYVGLGNNNGNRLGDMWEYDPATNQWTAKTAFGGTARYFSVGISFGGKGYVGTGIDLTQRKDWWEFDPLAANGQGQWKQRADLTGVARNGAVGFSIGHKGYVGTGVTINGYTNDFWDFSPSNSTLTAQGNTFNGANQLVQTNGSGQIPATVLPTSLTAQGNTFNGANQLVQTNGSGQIPATVLPTIIESEAYIAPSLQNSWANYSTIPNTYEPAGYYKDKMDRVHLKGLIAGGSTATETVLFTLPSGYRPTKRLLFTVATGSGSGRMDIRPNGEVLFVSGANSFFSLDGISFRATQ